MLRLFPDALIMPDHAITTADNENTMTHGNDGFFMARFHRQ
jgi:hypothetical protein